MPEANGYPVLSPLSFKFEGDVYTFPIEPQISVQGRNVLIRNHILKGRDSGTVKENWSADDYTIEIKQMVINEDEDRMPEADINRIRKFCEKRRVIEVDCPYLTLFGIQFLAIETYDFPHTNGYANQNFVIKGYSDKPFELF